MNSGMSRDDMIAFFTRRQRLYDAHDAAALAADYADAAVIESPMAGTHSGRTAAEQALRGAFLAFLDRTMTWETLLVDGDQAVQVCSVEGTHMGEFLGIPPSGKHFRLRIAYVYELRDRKIIRERRIYDFSGLLLQIGVLKAKPV